MGVWRGLLIAACLATGGCFPRADPSITAADPMDSIPAIQQAAASGDQHAVPALVGQLDNDDPAIRFYVISALRRLTGKDFDYRYFDDVDARRPAVDRWKAWMRQQRKQ